MTPGQDYKNLSEKKAPDVGLIVDNEGESVYYNESAGLAVPEQPVEKNRNQCDRFGSNSNKPRQAVSS